MDFESVFKLILVKFQDHNIDFALIGGFALHVAGYTRATQDIDFLIAQEDFPKVKKIMQSLGYEIIHESQDVSSFVGGMHELGRVDFLHAHRKYAKAMLARAQFKDILKGEIRLKVVMPQDLIGLKVQSSSNDPSRYYQDMADIESIIKVNFKQLNMEPIKEYFKIFKREKELEEILERLTQ